MEVVSLVPARDHASTRYRVGQYARHLASAGLRLRLEPLAKGAAGRFRQMTRRRGRTVVLLQRKLLPLWQLALLRRSVPLLVYDFDDAVFYRDSFHPRGPCSLTRAVRFRATVAMADYVLAGNDYLASQARQLTNPEKVMVVPTCVVASRYQPASHQEHRPTRLVWIGSSSTLRSLEAARNLLEAIGKAIPNTILRVICDSFPHFEHLRVEKAHWSSRTESTDLGGSDIGISWIPDDLWSQGKCGLKVLQYMAAGLPVVASPVGVHPQIIGQEAGILPSTTEEWVVGVRRLVENPSLRGQMGLQGRDRLMRSFDADTWGPVLANRLREATLRL